MTSTDTMTTTAIAPWFGGCRMLARRIGRQLGKLRWCGVPFCGGCPEIPHIVTAAGVASDLHRHVINLARVIRDPDLLARMQKSLERTLFHPDELAAAQRRCIERTAAAFPNLWGSEARIADPDPVWAVDYFICAWMGRGGHAGKLTEFTQGLAVRWTSSGGDSAKRFQSAIASLSAWHAALRRWSFVLQDAFEFLANVRDEPGHGLYVDAPWPDAGEEYAIGFSDAKQRRLADLLRGFKRARVVIRYGDHPLIRELYSGSVWNWVSQHSRNQRNNDVGEVLIINGPAALEEDDA